MSELNSINTLHLCSVYYAREEVIASGLSAETRAANTDTVVINFISCQLFSYQLIILFTQ